MKPFGTLKKACFVRDFIPSSFSVEEIHRKSFQNGFEKKLLTSRGNIRDGVLCWSSNRFSSYKFIYKKTLPKKIPWLLSVKSLVCWGKQSHFSESWFCLNISQLLYKHLEPFKFITYFTDRIWGEKFRKKTCYFIRMSSHAEYDTTTL